MTGQTPPPYSSTTTPNSLIGALSNNLNAGGQEGAGQVQPTGLPYAFNPISKKYDQELQKQQKQGFVNKWGSSQNHGQLTNVYIQKNSPAQGLLRSGSGNSLMTLGTPKIDQLSPQTFLISGPNAATGQ